MIRTYSDVNVMVDATKACNIEDGDLVAVVRNSIEMGQHTAKALGELHFVRKKESCGYRLDDGWYYAYYSLAKLDDLLREMPERVYVYNAGPGQKQEGLRWKVTGRGKGTGEDIIILRDMPDRWVHYSNLCLDLEILYGEKEPPKGERCLVEDNKVGDNKAGSCPFQRGQQVWVRDAEGYSWRDAKFLRYNPECVFPYEVEREGGIIETFRFCKRRGRGPKRRGIPKVFDKCLARDSESDPWSAEFFVSYVKHDCCPWVCLTEAYGQCVPYTGNEDILGTNKAPKVAWVDPKEWA